MVLPAVVAHTSMFQWAVLSLLGSNNIVAASKMAPKWRASGTCLLLVHGGSLECMPCRCNDNAACSEEVRCTDFDVATPNSLLICRRLRFRERLRFRG